MNEPSLQEKFAPASKCFGCGPANPKGLRIRSFVRGEETVASWQPEPHHEAFPACSTAASSGRSSTAIATGPAAVHLMHLNELDSPPCTVTADYAIKLLRPTPTDGPVELVARVVSSSVDRATIEGTLSAAGKPRATCRGTFVAVTPGHPAYHRW